MREECIHSSGTFQTEDDQPYAECPPAREESVPQSHGFSEEAQFLSRVDLKQGDSASHWWKPDRREPFCQFQAGGNQ